MYLSNVVLQTLMLERLPRDLIGEGLIDRNWRVWKIQLGEWDLNWLDKSRKLLVGKGLGNKIHEFRPEIPVTQIKDQVQSRAGMMTE